MESMWSNWAGNRALQRNFGDSSWLALHKANPGDGDTATEVAGNGYERQTITWSTPSGKKVSNTNTPIFDSMPAGAVLWLAAWTKKTGGNMIAKQKLDDALSVPLNGQVRMAQHDIAWAV